MRKNLKIKYLSLLIPIIILSIYSILNMISASSMSSVFEHYYIKQTIWCVLGFVILIIISKLKIKWIFKYSHIIYIINVALLILVLFFGNEINGTKAWFDLKFFSFQPSQFMKLSLLLFLTKVLEKNNQMTAKTELWLIIKVFLITLIPSILTFLEPDTGAVIIYFVIALFLLIATNIRTRWFIVIISITLVLGVSFIYFYHHYEDIFVNIFGTSFFYRMDRLINYKSGVGLQIENALIAVGTASMFGNGINGISIYLPEAPTDFVFALSVSNFGIVGCLIIISCYIFIFWNLVKFIKDEKNKINKLFMVGFTGMFIYQVIQNILMNIGMLPIMGITLPFLSYGGTSTLLYFITLGIILKMLKGKEKYPI